MSYILDALKKAERRRQAGAVPGLATVHASAPTGRRRVGRLVLAAALLANAGLAVMLLRQAPSESPPAPSALEPDGAAPAGAGERAGEPPTPHAPPSAVEPARDRVASSDAGSAAPAVGDRAAPPAPMAPDRTVLSPTPPAPEKPVPREVEPAPLADARTSRRPPDTAPASVASPARPEIPASFRQAVSGMRLEVLVYSDDPAGRQVFINGRKYVKGDRIDDTILVEDIVGEGVVLSWEGHRHFLRHLR